MEKTKLGEGEMFATKLFNAEGHYLPYMASEIALDSCCSNKVPLVLMVSMCSVVSEKL